jgi:3-oxoacyl-[acyl-carrier protein] reductase
VFDLTGRVALVTGAGQGVGVGIARALASRGAAVAVNDVDAERAARTAVALADTGATACAAPFDVTDRAAVVTGVSNLEAALGGPIDILVNNAGIPAGMALSSFRDLDPDEWSRYVDLNLYGSMHCIRVVLDGMCERGWGRVVQISSGAGHTGTRLGISLYGASKSAIEGLVRHVSQEVARHGVTVNTLALGLMTPRPDDADDLDPALASLARQVPVGRLGRPDDVGPAVVYLASDEAGWITGQTIDLNGGATT